MFRLTGAADRGSPVQAGAERAWGAGNELDERLDRKLDRKLVRGSAWLALSYGGSQLVSFVVTAVLARFLFPSDFGVVALATIIIAALAPVQESGLGAALIQRRTDVERAAGTALVFNVVVAICLYGVVFALAPTLASVFGSSRLAGVLRVLMLAAVIASPGVVPGALIERDLRFGSRAKGELGGALVRGGTAIPLAVAGFGVWSLVVGQLVGQAIQTAAYWRFAPLRPSPRRFDFGLLRQLGRFGRHITAANVVAFVDQNVDTATVGGMLGAADVGFYSLAWRLANFPATGIGYVIGRVMFPAYSTLQHDRAAFRAAFLTNVRRVALVSLPVAIAIVLTARPIVVGIFGPRWAPAVPPLQLLAVFGLARSFTGTTGPVFLAAGRSKLVFYLNLLHLAALCAALFTLIPLAGIRGAAAAVTLAMTAAFLPAWRLALRTLELPLSRLLRHIRRPATCSIPLAAALLGLELSTHSLTATDQLLLLLAAGALVYAAAAMTLARDEVRSIGAAFRSA
jgi:PST family polysaccharide transporter